MKRPLVIATMAGLAVAAVGISALTYAFSGTSSTTMLDRYSTVPQPDGSSALAGNVVAGRIGSKFHPLPWVGRAVSHVACPPLPARTGASTTCYASSNGTQLAIPVQVTKVSGAHVTWSFDR